MKLSRRTSASSATHSLGNTAVHVTLERDSQINNFHDELQILFSHKLLQGQVCFCNDDVSTSHQRLVLL